MAPSAGLSGKPTASAALLPKLRFGPWRKRGKDGAATPRFTGGSRCNRKLCGGDSLGRRTRVSGPSSDRYNRVTSVTKQFPRLRPMLGAPIVSAAEWRSLHDNGDC